MKNTRWAVAGLMILLAVSCTDQAKVYEQEIGTVFEKWTAVFNQHTDKLLKETDPDKTAQVILQCAKDFKELYREVGAVENKFTQLNSDQKGKAIENLKDINNRLFQTMGELGNAMGEAKSRLSNDMEGLAKVSEAFNSFLEATTEK